MTHYSQAGLTDLARGIAKTPEAEIHLQSCRKCRRDMAAWGAFARCARLVVESSTQPQAPDAVVRTVKGAFALHRPRKHSRLRRFATLLFDSLLEPATVGVRAAAPAMGSSIRQMLFRSGSVVVDLRLTPAGAGQVILVGQVLNLSRESIGSPAVRVLLERGRSALAAAVANEFGEFVLEYAEKDDLRLRLDVLGQSPLFIPLDGVSNSAGLVRAS